MWRDKLLSEGNLDYCDMMSHVCIELIIFNLISKLGLISDNVMYKVNIKS